MIKEIKDTIKIEKENIEQNLEIFIRREETKRGNTVSISLTLDGMEYVGHGKSYDVDEPIADLQKKHPKGTLIKCCVTCQYGHFCPYGSDGDTVLCIFPEKISDKLDLIDLMAEDRYHINKICCSCENFTPANKEFYSYNSFLDYLNS